MSASLSLALAIKELEPGEFHWILLDEAPSADDLLSYIPKTFSDPYKNAAAAWAAGYLMIRAALRNVPSN